MFLKETMNSSSLDDDVLAEKLRIENFNQFDTLVRMHLSFVLDLCTYDPEEATGDKDKSKKRKLVPFTKKTKNVKGIMDGVPLTQEGICQIYQLVEFLSKDENIKVEGIFRRTGSLLRQQELKNLLNRGSPLGLENNVYSVHDCASVLKGFLAELPEPLLTTALYSAHCQIANFHASHTSASDQQKVLYTIQLLLLLLPSENRILLKDILDLLQVVASHEGDNKMSAENLATVFTPHIVCPRHLTPQALHENLAKLTKIVCFMITKSKEIFKVPPKLAVDVRAYYTDRERRMQLSPKKNFDESVSDNVAANTVFSFVDVERTAKENESNPTETALAALYAHIQSLPESSKKKRLVKQFNKENGHGTPLQLLQNKEQEGRGSINSTNTRRGVKNKFSQLNTMNEEEVNNVSLTDESSQVDEEGEEINLTNRISQINTENEDGIVKLSSQFNDVKGILTVMMVRRPCNVQSPLPMPNLVMSPFQGLTAKAKLFCTKCDTSSDVSSEGSASKKLKKAYLSNENLSSDNNYSTKNQIQRSNSDPNLSIDCNNEKVHNLYLTSTPAHFLRHDCSDLIFTPQDQGRKSMSPITRSTQRMSKAMQESMMTPRSRKPVLVVSGTNINNLPKLEMQDCTVDLIKEELSSPDSCSRITPKKSKSVENLTEENSDPLSNTFREYLKSRSILTATPTDLSFTSCPGDYCSTGLNSTTEMSSSLLHCLNGFTPPESRPFINREASSGNLTEDCDGEKELVLRPKQFDDNGKPIVYETSF